MPVSQLSTFYHFRISELSQKVTVPDGGHSQLVNGHQTVSFGRRQPSVFVDDFFFSFRMHSYREMCRPFCTLSYSHQNLECRLKKPRLQGHYSPALLYQPPQKWVSVLRFHAFSLLIALYKIPLPWEGHCRTKMKAELILADEKVFLQQKKRTFSLRITLHCDPTHNKKLWYAIFPFGLFIVYGVFAWLFCQDHWFQALNFKSVQWFFIFSSSFHCRKNKMIQHVIENNSPEMKIIFMYSSFLFTLLFLQTHIIFCRTQKCECKSKWGWGLSSFKREAKRTMKMSLKEEQTEM